ncbi:YitT family protein [Lactiplantibacillus sp. WILCCON 0030]|uniref:YitT family protein n=1 Tax=Lactiplantibacillus brownii TaxID=3069269 RepID=A0ABU1A8L4_9LACO|nr:YitT family protein [Lactiplantibacillus brownii]MDQ7937307.1 YitT family protein [Lactiplantibacillus brownii]
MSHISNPRLAFLWQLVIMVASALVSAFALNEFLIPANTFSGGVNGIAQILYSAGKGIGFQINTGYYILLFNIPIALLGWFKLGHRFTIMSFITAFLTSAAAVVLPVVNIAHNPLLGALFGGILTGVGIGITMRYGFSTGGFDIIVLVLERLTGRTVGSLMFLINFAIILMSGVLFSWENALFTIISIYASTRMVDLIHTRHQKLTAIIVTTQAEAVAKAIQTAILRGVTIADSHGGYSGQPNATLMVVLSRYELFALQAAVQQTDDHAFINILNTVDTSGLFMNERQQAEQRKSLQN